MIKGRAEENASFFIFTIIALAITRVTARSRCVQTSPTSFVAYGKSSKGKVYQTCRRSVLASYGSPRGQLVHVHVFTHFSSVLNLHSITYLLKIALTVHGFEPFSSLGRLGLICNGPVASSSFQDHVPKRNDELWGREWGSSRSQSRAPCSRRQLQLNLFTTATLGTEKSGRCRGLNKSQCVDCPPKISGRGREVAIVWRSDSEVAFISNNLISWSVSFMTSGAPYKTNSLLPCGQICFTVL